MAEINDSVRRSRRLTVEQVRALEKAFEMDNKLESERKGQLAHQLALQERQIAVWFQNRRARWKTKQLERDHRILSKKLESLKADRDKLIKEKEKLEFEVMRLKSDKTKVMLEAAAEEGRRIALSDVDSVGQYTNAVPIYSSAEKEKDGSSITNCSVGKITRDKEAAISPSTSTPANPLQFEDIIMQAETIDLLDFTSLYCGGMICAPQT